MSFTVKKPAYMIYYGILNDSVIENAVQYDIAILHPKSGDLTRAQVARIQAAGTKVLGYLSVGEDLRTAGLSTEQMRADARFSGDGSGPKTDPRGDNHDSIGEDDWHGCPSPGGTGWASYYLDDNDCDGVPDRNPVFTCAYTNIGDPAWWKVLDGMTLDGADGAAGMREILTETYGRGLGCDGLFLDTIDTCAPNAYTTDDDPCRTRFEWTAAGVPAFLADIRKKYPHTMICQNRGLFFFHPLLPHYRFCTRTAIDYLMFESYGLDSSAEHLYHDNYYADNRYGIAPKLIAEASRPDGFSVLSLGYAEGPEEYCLKETLQKRSERGMEILLSDLRDAQAMGFSHYITDGALTLCNDFVLTHQADEEKTPPVWSSVCNDPSDWPPLGPLPRVGIVQAEALGDGEVVVRWDAAIHRNGVSYRLYYQDQPFDFCEDPDLTGATSVWLVPDIGRHYGESGCDDACPYEAKVGGLTVGRQYYFVIRASEACDAQNQEKNTVCVTAEVLSLEFCAT